MTLIQKVWRWLFPWKPNAQRLMAEKHGKHYISVRELHLFDVTFEPLGYPVGTVFLVTRRDPADWEVDPRRIGKPAYDVVLAFPKSWREYTAYRCLDDVVLFQRYFRQLSPLEILAVQAE